MREPPAALVEATQAFRLKEGLELNQHAQEVDRMLMSDSDS